MWSWFGLALAAPLDISAPAGPADTFEPQTVVPLAPRVPRVSRVTEAPVMGTWPLHDPQLLRQDLRWVRARGVRDAGFVSMGVGAAMFLASQFMMVVNLAEGLNCTVSGGACILPHSEQAVSGLAIAGLSVWTVGGGMALGGGIRMGQVRRQNYTFAVAPQGQGAQVRFSVAL